MKKYLITVTFCIMLILCNKAIAQSTVPASAANIVNMNLEDAQKSLTNKGYEIAASNYFKKTQLWWNETEKVCISLSFDKSKEKKITSVNAGDVEKCKSGVEAGRKVWEKYHDGASPATSAVIEKEREKLKSSGYTVSYWIEDAAPGRSTEYWKNASGQCKHIIWNTQDKGNVSVDDCEAKYGDNPAPKK